MVDCYGVFLPSQIFSFYCYMVPEEWILKPLTLLVIDPGLGQEIGGENVLVSDILYLALLWNSNDKHYLSNSGGEVLAQLFP